MTKDNAAPPVVAGEYDGLIEWLRRAKCDCRNSIPAADALAAMQAEKRAAVEAMEAMAVANSYAQARIAALTEALKDMGREWAAIADLLPANRRWPEAVTKLTAVLSDAPAPVNDFAVAAAMTDLIEGGIAQTAIIREAQSILTWYISHNRGISAGEAVDRLLGLFDGPAQRAAQSKWDAALKGGTDAEPDDDPTYHDNWHEDPDMGAR